MQLILVVIKIPVGIFGFLKHFYPHDVVESMVALIQRQFGFAALRIGMEP
nr:hypothetical protein [Chamaesiphon sp. VAR_69_metabat_338]